MIIANSGNSINKKTKLNKLYEIYLITCVFFNDFILFSHTRFVVLLAFFVVINELVVGFLLIFLFFI